jgi:glucose-6-phosphate isomerase
MRFWKGQLPVPEIRTIEDLRGVLADRTCGASGALYTMYRDLALTPGDRDWLSEHHLRYDITVISPRDLCGEKAKTKGHYHPVNAAGTGYPEIYEVLEGSAHYILQQRDLSDVIMVRAGKGDRVMVPPFYGHVTVNAGREDLVMANLVSSDFISDYAEYESRRGAAYYELSDGSIVRNTAYDIIPELRIFDASRLSRDLSLPGCALYDLIGNDILEFLNLPERYPILFKGFP